MGLEITKIENQILKTVAMEADQNQDGYISGRDELNIFEKAAKKAVENDLCAKADLKAAMASFEVAYPMENDYLTNLAVQYDEDQSGELTNNEIKHFVKSAKNAKEADFVTEEDIETATDGYYQKKSVWQKIGRVALIAGSGMLVGFLGMRYSGKAISNLIREGAKYGYSTKLAESINLGTAKLTDLGRTVTVTSALGAGVAAGATAGAVTAKLTDKDR